MFSLIVLSLGKWDWHEKESQNIFHEVKDEVVDLAIVSIRYCNQFGSAPHWHIKHLPL